MRGVILSLAMGALLLGGCCNRYCRDTTLYQLSGRQKPVVAVLPVIDATSKHNLSWSLSDEFTDEIRRRVYESRKIYLLREGGTMELARQLSVPNPQAISSSAAQSLGTAEYVLVTELIEQKEVPYNGGNDTRAPRREAGKVFTLGLRVRVLDIRGQTPRLVLQEVLDQDVVIDWLSVNCDYSKMPWGTDAFTHTPMGMAHNRLVRALVARVESYIEASR